MTLKQLFEIFVKLARFDCNRATCVSLQEAKSIFGPIWVRKCRKNLQKYRNPLEIDQKRRQKILESYIRNVPRIFSWQIYFSSNFGFRYKYFIATRKLEKVALLCVHCDKRHMLHVKFSRDVYAGCLVCISLDVLLWSSSSYLNEWSSSSYLSESPDAVRRYSLETRCILMYIMRAGDMNACCIVGFSESPEAAIGRLQVQFPTWTGVFLSSCFVCFYPRWCTTSLVGQSAGQLIPSSSVWFWQRIRNREIKSTRVLKYYFT